MLDGRCRQVLDRGLCVNYVSYHLAECGEVLLWGNPNELLNLSVHYNDPEMILVEQWVLNWHLRVLNPAQENYSKEIRRRMQGSIFTFYQSRQPGK